MLDDKGNLGKVFRGGNLQLGWTPRSRAEGGTHY